MSKVIKIYMPLQGCYNLASDQNVTTSVYAVTENTLANKIHSYTFQTDNSYIMTVITVVVNIFVVKAFIKICLITSTVHIFQEDRSSSTIKNATINIDCYCICKLYIL